MPYLIDGHNLIAQLPDIELDDPDDEAKLVLKLRSFSSRVGKRVVVVFDHGLPGEVSTRLSTHSVIVRFASEHTSADHVMRDMIRRTEDPASWIVVSSDTEVRDIAKILGMRTISSHDFAPQLKASPKVNPKIKAAQQVISKKVNPHLSSKEVDDWLNLFGAKSEE
jgi:predicted RNA-binding protein with PIN domain